MRMVMRSAISADRRACAPRPQKRRTIMALTSLCYYIIFCLLTSLAIVVRVALVLGRTRAARAVHNRLTLGVLTARRLHRARVDALRVEACLVERAIRVTTTSVDAAALFADLARAAARVRGAPVVLGLVVEDHALAWLRAHLARLDLLTADRFVVGRAFVASGRERERERERKEREKENSNL